LAVIGGAGAVSDASLRSQAIQQFQSAMASELAAATDADEAACIRSVRGVTIANLQRVITRADGTAIQTTEVLSHEYAVLSSRLQRAQTGGL
jgi:hypothetical protein